METDASDSARRSPASRTSATDMSGSMQPGRQGTARTRYPRKITGTSRTWAKTLIVSMLATSGSSGRHARVSGRRGTARLAAGALAAAALLSGLAVTGFAGVASAATPPSVTFLYAAPNGPATSGCTSASSPCSLATAITAAGSLNGAAVTIMLEHSTGLPCSASDICTFSGNQSVSSGSEASLTIEGSATGSGSSAYSVLDANGAGTTFTDSATTFPVTLDNVTVTGGSAYSGGRAMYYRGGGIYNTSAAPLTVVDSTISGIGISI